MEAIYRDKVAEMYLQVEHSTSSISTSAASTAVIARPIEQSVASAMTASTCGCTKFPVFGSFNNFIQSTDGLVDLNLLTSLADPWQLDVLKQGQADSTVWHSAQ